MSIHHLVVLFSLKCQTDLFDIELFIVCFYFHPRPPCFLPVENVRELEPLTDFETEKAVQALQSFNAHTFCPSPEVQSLTPAPLQPVTPHTDCRLPLSPVMPVLDAEPQTNQSASHQAHTHPLSLYPSTDTYSLPPVLSPQVSFPSHMMEAHSLYSEPPVLSPQQYTEEGAVEGRISERDSLENVPQFVSADTAPASPSFLSSVAPTSTEDVQRLNKDYILGLQEIMCSSMDWESAISISRRACSLPRLSATAPNLKKRCRSASPEPTRSKRKRTTDQGCKTEETEMSGCEGCLSLDKLSCPLSQPSTNQNLSSSCTDRSLTLQQMLTVFPVPTVQTLTLTSNQMDTLDQGATHVTNQPSCSLSKSKTFDPPPSCPHDKSLSSQESQRSVSLSTSVCIEPALIPDVAAVCPSSSDSDWDCDLLSRMVPTSTGPPSPAEQGFELDKDLLHRPCTWMHDTSYESRLHNVLEAPSAATLQCGEELDSSSFSRTVVQIVEVQH